jgi:acyl-CoA synthetase (NDP forming)/GNAT superfamily N-acetyltransferase
VALTERSPAPDVPDFPYPEQWEADVVVRDGSIAHLRPITPRDADRLVRFYTALSPQTIYFRFFAPHPRLSDAEVTRFTVVDQDRRAALVATLGDEIIGVVRYESLTDDEAEVAFLVRDDHQGRGLGAVLLEHIAQAARERGIRRFIADILPENGRMVSVFRDAGYEVSTSLDGNVLRLELTIEETAESAKVSDAREQRAEARSIERLLHPRSVVVVGEFADRAAGAHRLLAGLVRGGFTGAVSAVDYAPDAAGTVEIDGVQVVVHRRVTDVPGPLDLAVIAVDASVVETVVDQCADSKVHGLVVISDGFAESGPRGAERQRALRQSVRAAGMRLVGPNALGIVNTDPAVALNASLAPTLPPHGTIGLFSQSGALGIALLAALRRRGLGLSTFVSAGNRADVSGNDLIQYWQEDPGTEVLLVYLESVGNPRKFARLARRTSRTKPIVAAKSGHLSQGIPSGHAVRTTKLPPAAVEALFRQSGIVQVDTLGEMFDVATVLTQQPRPTGPRVALISNSDALAVLGRDACVLRGLVPIQAPRLLAPNAGAEDWERELTWFLDDPDVDSVFVVYAPPAAGAASESIARRITAAAQGRKPVVATVAALDDLSRWLSARPAGEVETTPGSVPTFGTVEAASTALAAATRYGAWRTRPVGTVPEFANVDADAARTLVLGLLETRPEGLPLAEDDLRRLLSCYGVRLWADRPAPDEDAAVAAAAELGWPVVLKVGAPHLTVRTDLGFVRSNLVNEEALRRTYRDMIDELGSGVAGSLVVQRMAGRGVGVFLETVEDRSLGPVISFGIGGTIAELVGDRVYRFPPLTDVDAAEMVLEPRAAPLLSGYGGAPAMDFGALQELMLRVSQLADDLPEVARLTLGTVLAMPRGLAVLGATAELAPPVVRPDTSARRLRR